MAPQDSFIDDDEESWYVLSHPTVVDVLVPQSSMLTIPLVLFVWKSSTFQTKTSDHALVDTRYTPAIPSCLLVNSLLTKFATDLPVLLQQH